MTSTLLKVFDFEVFGRVQGVFFRKFTVNKANELGIVGWVMNTKVGTVVGQAEGPSSKVEVMKDWLSRIGSPHSKIQRCEIKNEREISKTSFSKFEVRKVPKK